MPSLPRALLFLRCVPVPDALAALADVRRRAGGLRVEVLTTPASAGAIEQSGLADAVIPYGGASFGLRQAGIRLLSRLRRRGYAVVVVPHPPGRRAAFWNVARVALAVGAERTVWQPAPDADAASEAWTPISWRSRWAGRAALPGIRAAVLAGVRVPGLVLGWILAMALLAVTAAVLAPLVWLKPEGR